MNILHIDSSPLAANSTSRQLTRDIVAELRASRPDAQVTYLDLVKEAPSHLDMDSLGMRLGLEDASLSDTQRRENAISERLVSQFLAADVVVVGAPMYNFTVPSQLKAWIDRVAQVGRTFKYTAQGAVGLATGKTVIVASSRGGMYSAGPAAAMDHQESYLRSVFGFFGVTDLRIVRAEGLAMGDEAKAKALADATADIGAIGRQCANDARSALAA